ncbi:MAG: Spy/CpxP family protein refolding chaperone [Acidobacteria bacterium]|nr:Spy/CpxP family protein refolding chaperone [Acidobacteriota bacterium]
MRSLKAVPVLLGLLAFGWGPAELHAVQASSDRGSRQPSRASRWWHDEDTKKALGLTPEQSAKVERIFQSSLEELRALREEAERLESLLSAAIADPNSTEAQVSEQADLVEAARARLGKARTMMLFKMRRVLTPEQRLKLEQLHKHSQRDNSRRHDR